MRSGRAGHIRTSYLVLYVVEQSDESALESSSNRLAPILNVELRQDLGDMPLDRAGTEEEFVRNLGIGQALAEESQDLTLPPGEA